MDIQAIKDDENALYCSVRTKEKGLRKVCDYAGYIDATKFTANFGQILDTVIRKGSNPVKEEARSCREKSVQYTRKLGRFLTSILIWCDPFEPYGVKNLKLEKSEKFPNLKATISRGVFKNVDISVDLVPVFKFPSDQSLSINNVNVQVSGENNIPSEPQTILYAIPKDALANKSLPICFSAIESRIIRDAPEYMRRGLRIAKILRIELFKNNRDGFDPDDVTSYMLKTCLLRILLRNRNQRFLMDFPGNHNISEDFYAVFWASLILSEMQEIFGGDDVEFLRIQDECARHLFPHVNFLFRKIFFCPQIASDEDRMCCCDVKDKIRTMLRHIQNFIRTEMQVGSWQTMHIQQFYSSNPGAEAFSPDSHFNTIDDLLQNLVS